MRVKAFIYSLIKLFKEHGYWWMFMHPYPEEEVLLPPYPKKQKIKREVKKKSASDFSHLSDGAALKYFFRTGIEIPDKDYIQIKEVAQRLGVQSEELINLLAISTQICKVAFHEEKRINSPLIRSQNSLLIKESNDLEWLYKKVVSGSPSQRDLIGKIKAVFTFGSHSIEITHPENYLHALSAANEHAFGQSRSLKKTYRKFNFEETSANILIDHTDLLRKDVDPKHLRVLISNRLTKILLTLIEGFCDLTDKKAYTLIFHVLSIAGIQMSIEKYYEDSKKPFLPIVKGYSAFEVSGYSIIKSNFKRYNENI